jgi:hypothetical protein
LDVIDVTIWTGDAKNANFISGQFQLLYDNIQEARQALRGYSDVQRPWTENPVDEQVGTCSTSLAQVKLIEGSQIFDPPLPHNVSFKLSIFDAALLLEIRTLELINPAEESHSGFDLRSRLAMTFGGTRPPIHDEVDRTFEYRGKEVRVKEKIRVESQDPALISAMAKLNALEHSVGLGRKALNIVMGKEE